MERSEIDAIDITIFCRKVAGRLSFMADVYWIEVHDLDQILWECRQACERIGNQLTSS